MTQDQYESLREALNKQDYTLRLNNDCLSYVFTFMSRADLCALSSVCKRWMHAIGDVSHWLRVSLRGCHITDWTVAVSTLTKRHVHHLDLSHMSAHGVGLGDTEDPWALPSEELRVGLLLRIPSLKSCVLPCITVSTLERIAAQQHTVDSLAVRLHTRDSSGVVVGESVDVDFGRLRGLARLTRLRLSAHAGIAVSAFSFGYDPIAVFRDVSLFMSACDACNCAGEAWLPCGHSRLSHTCPSPI